MVSGEAPSNFAVSYTGSKNVVALHGRILTAIDNIWLVLNKRDFRLKMTSHCFPSHVLTCYICLYIYTYHVNAMCGIHSHCRLYINNQLFLYASSGGGGGYPPGPQAIEAHSDAEAANSKAATVPPQNSTDCLFDWGLNSPSNTSSYMPTLKSMEGRFDWFG